MRRAVLRGQLDVRTVKNMGRQTFSELCVFAKLPVETRRCRTCGVTRGRVAVDLRKGDMLDLNTATGLLFRLYEQGWARHGDTLCDPHLRVAVSEFLTPVRYKTIKGHS